MLDLDKAQEQRWAARIGAHEGRGTLLPIRWHGKEIATLPAELPIDVLAPLRVIDQDISLLLSQAFRIAGQQADPMAATQVVVDLLVSNPNLPAQVLDVVREMGQALLGQDGYDTFLAGRPSTQDAVALIRGIVEWYGVSLGEASGSSDASTPGGPTSNQISDTTTTDSTSAGSTGQSAIPSTSEPAT